jgi:hypothetical protein
MGGRLRRGSGPTLATAIVVAAMASGAATASALNVGSAAASQIARFSTALASYQHAVSSTKPAEVVSQMRAYEASLSSCVQGLKHFYATSAATETGQLNHRIVNELLTFSAQAQGERWESTPAIPVLESALTLNDRSAGSAEQFIDERVRPAAEFAFCPAFRKWSQKGFANADTPSMYNNMTVVGGIYPVDAVGTKPATTFKAWGVSADEAKQLTVKLLASANQAKALDKVANEQFIDWLEHKGIYAAMTPEDQQSMVF